LRLALIYLLWSRDPVFALPQISKTSTWDRKQGRCSPRSSDFADANPRYLFADQFNLE
jgi:hypothetical protein